MRGHIINEQTLKAGINEQVGLHNSFLQKNSKKSHFTFGSTCYHA